MSHERARIANAALVEIGLEPVWRGTDGEVVTIPTTHSRGPHRRDYLRADKIALMAIHGPTYPVECDACQELDADDVCGLVPVALAIQGATCEAVTP